MFRKFLPSKSRLSKPVSKRRRTRRLCVEGLENRHLLAFFNWVAAGDGDFGVAANWLNTLTNNPGVPGPGDTANIGDVQVTSSVSRTVNNIVGVGSLKVTGGTFSVQNSLGDTAIFGLIVESGATFRTNGGTSHIIGSEISGVINVQPGGTFRFLRGLNQMKVGSNWTGSGTYLAAGDAFGAPTVELQKNLNAPTNFLLQNGTLTGSGNLTITGVFNWNSNNTVVMAGTGQTIVNAGATLNILGNAGHLSQRTINNSGTIFFGATSDLFLNSNATINNLASGTIQINTDSSILGGITNTISNAGLIKKTLGTGTSRIGVQLLNTGTLNVETGNLALFGGVGANGTYQTATGTTIDLTGGNAYELGGTSNFTGNGMVITGSGFLSTASTGGTWVIPATVTFLWTSGTLVVPIGAVQNVNGNIAFNGATETVLRGGGTFRVNGNLTHGGTGDLHLNGDLATNSVATILDIPSTRNLLLMSTGRIIASGAGGNITNAGTISKSAGAGSFTIQSRITNTGTIRSSTGTLRLHNVESTGGTLTAGAGATLFLGDHGSSRFVASGNMVANGSGTIAIILGLFEVASSGLNMSIGAPTQFIWSSGAIRVPVGSTATLTGSLRIDNSDTVIAFGGGTLVLNGLTRQTGAGNVRVDGDGSAGATTIRIPSGRTYQMENDSGLAAGFNGSGTIDNLGLIRKSAGNGASRITMPLQKAANLQVDTGVLQLGANNSTVRGGNFSIADGAILDLIGPDPANITYEGTFTGSGLGQVQLNRGTLIASPSAGGVQFSLPAGQFRWLAGNMDTNASTIAINSTINFVGSTNVIVLGTGFVVVHGTFEHQSTGNIHFSAPSTLVVETTGTYNLRKDASLTGVGTLNNRGTFRKNGGTGNSNIALLVTNSGNIESRIGTLNLTGGKSELVGQNLTSGTWGVFSTSTNSASLNFNAAINTIGLAATVKLSGPNSSIPNIGGLASIVGNFQLLNGASFANNTNLSNSGKITLSSTSVFDVSGNYTEVAGSRVTYQFNNASIGQLRTLGDVTLVGNLTVTFTGTPPAIGNSVTIIENQGPNAIAGDFAGFPQNAILTLGGTTWRIRYNQGSGNDATLLRLT